MNSRDVFACNAKITDYLRKNDLREAISVLRNMKRERISPNHITFSKIIGSGETVLGFREVLHAQSVIHGVNSDIFVGCSLVKGYANDSRLGCAARAFGEIDDPDLVSFNIMIDGCVRNNSKFGALRTFSQMLQREIRFNSFTLTCMLKTCSEPEDMSRGVHIHCHTIKCGFVYETEVCNSIITMYARCEKGATSSPAKIFRSISRPNVISWTSLISGLMQNGEDMVAAEIYQEMCRSGVNENCFTFSAVLAVSSNLARLVQGRQVHARIEKSIHGFDLLVNNALIDMYSKCGSVEDAYSVFVMMGRHDIVSCTMMITGFGKHGRGRQALEILLEMEREGPKPDGVTFLACLSACSHGGLVDAGVQIFRMMMTRNRDLNVGREHFCCVVDMFGRAGRLDEAEEFINEVGLGMNLFVWEALLGACRTYGEISLGQVAAAKIMDLDHGNDGSSLLLANMYADSGLWENKGLVRKKLDFIRSKKEVGNSWVGTVYSNFK